MMNLFLISNALATCFFAAHVPIKCAEQTTNPLPIQFNLELLHKGKMVPGQPVILHYSVTNTTDQWIGWEPGDDALNWFTLKLTDDKNQEVTIEAPKPPKKNPHISEVLYKIASPQIAPNHSVEGYLLVTRYYPALQTGQYHLTVKVQTPYAFVPSIDEDSTLDQVKKAIRTSGTRYRKEFGLTLNVGEPNNFRLVKIAEELREALVAADNNNAQELKKTLGEAICSLPEATAMTVWQQVAVDTRVSRRFIATNLVGIGSSRAAYLIEDMEWGAAGMVERNDSYSAADYLRLMYHYGDATLREQISRIGRRHKILFEPPSAR